MYDIAHYYDAKTVEEAVSLLNEHPDAKIIAGGSDMLIKIREGNLAQTSLVAIRNSKGLSGIVKNEEGDILIGACTAFSHVTDDHVINACIPVLGEAVDKVGGPQVRNMGTIGGNICNGAVSADSAPTLFSLEVKLQIANAWGGRMVPIGEFYLGPGRVDLKQGEVLTQIVVPHANYEGYTGHYMKYSMREAMDIAALSCCVVCKADGKAKVLQDVKITFGVAAPTPFRCRLTEERLKGRPLEESLYQLTEDSIRQEINPRDSWRASKAFRMQIGGEIARRALQEAIARQEA